MQRVKKKKPIKQKMVLGKSEVEKMKREVSNQLLGRMGLLIIAAVMDEVGLNDEQLGGIIERTNRYADHISSGVLTWADVRSAIEKGTGVSMKGW